MVCITDGPVVDILPSGNRDVMILISELESELLIWDEEMMDNDGVDFSRCVPAVAAAAVHVTLGASVTMIRTNVLLRTLSMV